MRRSKDQRLDETLANRGLRSTRHRHHVYNVILQKRDHPTVEEIYKRAKHGMADISLATVYNCLDALVDCGLVREVNLDRSPTRYCPNMHDHCHFYCDSCEQVIDIDLLFSQSLPGVHLPKGCKPTRFDLCIHGTCPECSRKYNGMES